MLKLISWFFIFLSVKCVVGRDLERLKLEEDLTIEAPSKDVILPPRSKFLPIFQVVKFENEMCTGDNGRMGVCYPWTTCLASGGDVQGKCALGMGVCCQFAVTCGEEVKHNVTYWQSEGNTVVSPCFIEVPRLDRDICTIRLDFEEFNLPQPSSTICENGRFEASSEGTDVPLICGNNAGHHIYLAANDVETHEANLLRITWSTGASPVSWKIKISQIGCTNPGRPPIGCLQYYTGTSGTIESFNFAGSQHLADQRQFICIRTEKGYCQIAYSADSTNFQLSITTPVKEFNNDFCQTDYVVIPQGYGTTIQQTNDYYCGNMLATPDLMLIIDGLPNDALYDPYPGTVYSTFQPFKFNFRSDGSDENSDTQSKGFKVDWKQNKCPI